MTAKHLSFLPTAKRQTKEAAEEALNTPGAALSVIPFEHTMNKKSHSIVSLVAAVPLPSPRIKGKQNLRVRKLQSLKLPMVFFT